MGENFFPAPGTPDDTFTKRRNYYDCRRLRERFAKPYHTISQTLFYNSTAPTLFCLHIYHTILGGKKPVDPCTKKDCGYVGTERAAASI